MGPSIGSFLRSVFEDQSLGLRNRGRVSLRLVLLATMFGLFLFVLLLQSVFYQGKSAVLQDSVGLTPPLSDLIEACAEHASRKPSVSRSSFPGSFVFGTATSAYQVEGAPLEDGKGKSIWDTFAHTEGKIADSSDGDVADDSYHQLEADVQLMRAMGVQSYRFSIAWSRVLPEGSGAPNEAGIAYYNKLIDSLLAAGITPAGTLYHWDLPQALQDKYKGWLNRDVVDDFAQYASLCFSRFGDRVKTWITLNEPQQTTVQGYGGGSFAPGRCSDRSRCAEGDSSTEPYLAGHHLLMAHAAAVKEYRTKFQKAQGGKIGITLDCTFMFPLDPTNPKDRSAANKGMEFQLPWFMDPVMNGSYPLSMSKALGGRLPQWGEAESALIRGSADFLGLNFYTASYATEGQPPAPGQENPWTDRGVWSRDTDMDGHPIGETAGSPWLKVVPRSIYYMLLWINKRYPNLPILITENGVSQNGSLSMEDAMCDEDRIDYHREHLTYILMAIRKGVPVEAYYAWSLMDNFEWAAGYTQRFGIHYVDFSNPLRPRLPKASALWWESFLKKKGGDSTDALASASLAADGTVQ